MSDADFLKMMERIRDNENEQLVYLEVIEFERDISLRISKNALSTWEYHSTSTLPSLM